MKSGRDKPRKVRIKSRLNIVGVNPYVLVRKREATSLKRDWHGPMPVRYAVSGDPDLIWRINMMPLGDGNYRLYLRGVVR